LKSGNLKLVELEYEIIDEAVDSTSILTNNFEERGLFFFICVGIIY